MSADTHVQAPPIKKVEYPVAVVTCSSCGHNVGSAKFCPECGTPAAPQKATCPGCGFQPDASVKFCPECGAKIPFVS
jgi:predicted amidophosphoribosyltransferase